MIEGLPEKLKAERKRMELTQIEVAEAIGSTKAMITKYEKGHVTPPTEILVKLAGFYRVSADYLIGIEKDRTVNVSNLKDSEIKVIENLVDEFSKYK